MKITLKNVKIIAALSEETLCYSATVYVDGRRAFIATNHGHGGSDDYRPIDAEGAELLRAAEAYAESLPSLVFDGIEIENNLELLISELLETAEKERATARLLARATIVKDGTQWRKYSAPYSPALADRIKRERPSAIILNAIPLSEAAAMLA